MKHHEKHHNIHSSSNTKPQTQRETTACRSFVSLGSTISPDMKHTRHEKTLSLGGIFSFKQLSRLRATDVPAGCNSIAVSCGVWFHSLEGCKGHTHKGHREKKLNVMTFSDFSGCFQGVFGGVFRVFSGCFQGVFPYALSGYALWNLSNSGFVVL